MTEDELLGFLHNAFEYYKKSRKVGSSKRHIEIAEIKIRRLVENKKVSREFVERWEDNFAQDIGESGSPKFIGPSKKGLARMLTELGHEVEVRRKDE